MRRLAPRVVRRLVAETDVRPRHLVLPVFVAEGLDAHIPRGYRTVLSSGKTLAASG